MVLNRNRGGWSEHRTRNVISQACAPALPFLFCELCDPSLRPVCIILGALGTVLFPLLKQRAVAPGSVAPGSVLLLQQEYYFVLLQLHGWTLIGVNLGLGAIFLLNPVKSGVVGMAGGGTSIFGVGMVLWSLRYFKPRTVLQHLCPHQQTNTTPFSLSIAGMLGCVITDVFKAQPFAKPMLVAACCFSLAAALYTHFILSYQIPHYKWWQPFEGGAGFVVLQAEGWMLTGLFLNFGIGATIAKQRLDAPFANGVIALFGGLQLFGQMLLLGSLPLFHREAPVTEDRETRAIRPGRGQMAAVVVWLCALLLAVGPIVLWITTRVQLYTSADGEPWLAAEPSILFLAMLLSAPLSHISGLIQYGSKYHIIQPLFGGFTYILNQVFGWSLYASSVVAVLAFAFIHHPVSESAHDIEHYIPLCFAAQVLIAASIPYFNSQDDPVRPKTTESPPQYKLGTVEHQTSERTAVLRTSLLGVGTCFVALLFALAWEWGTGYLIANSGWVIFGLFGFVTLSGFHIVYTHVWLVTSACLMLVDNDLAHASCACLGVNISCAWYASLCLQRDLRIPWRALDGWGYHSLGVLQLGLTLCA